jgi:Amidohydrolase family
VPIGARTDQSVPGYSLHRDLEPYVKAGVTPMEAIRSATIVPASAMKLDQESATIEAGKRADLILVAGRPDRVISDIGNVKSVIAAGRAYECAERWKSVGFRPLIGERKRHCSPERSGRPASEYCSRPGFIPPVGLGSSVAGRGTQAESQPFAVRVPHVQTRSGICTTRAC